MHGPPHLSDMPESTICQAVLRHYEDQIGPAAPRPDSAARHVL